MAVYVNGQAVGVTKELSKPDRLQWKCDNLKTLYYEFYNYQGRDLSILEGLDTSKVTDMRSVFTGCSLIKDLPKIDTSNATTLYYAFQNCSQLTDLSFVKTDNATNLGNTFTSCNNLSHEFNLNTDNCTNMSYTFSSCRKVPKITLSDTSKITTFNSAFASCTALEQVSHLDCSSCTSLMSAFASCSNLQNISVSNTEKVTSFYAFAQYDSVCHTIETLDMISATSSNYMFMYCYKLKNLKIKNVKINLQIGQSTIYGHLLTNESLLNTAQELWDNTNNALGGARTLTMSTPSKTAIQGIYVKLVDVTDDMRAEDEYIDNKKPCIECASTDDGAMTLEEYIISKNWSIA